MTRTRTTAHAPSAEPATRRNPSRSSRAANPRPSRRAKRPRTHLSNDHGSSSGEDDSDAPTPDIGATDSDTNSEIESSSDKQFSSRSRRKPTRTSSRILTAQSTNRRRSARQAAISSPQQTPQPDNGPRLPSPRARSTRQRQGRTSNVSNTPKKRRKTLSLEPETILPQGTAPDWRDPKIPYGAWTDIFYYAASSGSPESLEVNWLIGAATTCKAFSEAALTAIYRSPPVNTVGKARRLAALLERPPSETQLNYRMKIESLYLDISVVPQAILYKLIHPLPRLKELVFCTQYDQPPYRELDRTIRWHYFDDIFRALLPASSESSSSEGKAFPTFLKSWEWNGRLLGGPVATIDSMTQLHQQPFFKQLTKLSFTNLQVPSLRMLRPKPGDDEGEMQLYNQDGAVISSVAEAISQLQSLRHLVFESSTVMNDRLLPLLPKNLFHLGLVNCWEVKSEDFTPFLHSHGYSLRTLALSHNQSLDMAFLTDLADACPNLEELYMNLSYFRHHDSLSLVNNDADPLYDQALLPNQVPKWPPSIRVINLEHVRHWSVEAAEVFLQSLINSAGNLPNLRHLAVKTMLNIPWKARANMRHAWCKRLERVFLRPFEPMQSRTTLRQPEVVTDQEPTQSPRKSQVSKAAGPSRRSGRFTTQTSDSNSHQNSNSKSLRNVRDRPLYKEPDTDDDEFDVEAGEDGGDITEEDTTQDKTGTNGSAEMKDLVIQGLCTTVAVVFDNQKPTELQYGMEDFMDDERSESDEEWDGDEEEDDTVFVWR